MNVFSVLQVVSGVLHVILATMVLRPRALVHPLLPAMLTDQQATALRRTRRQLALVRVVLVLSGVGILGDGLGELFDADDGDD